MNRAIVWRGAKACLAVVALLMSGCTALPGGAQIDSPGPYSASRQFHGLIPAIGDAPTQSKTRYIFVIHGMGATEEGYSRPLIDAITALGYRHSPGVWRDVPLSTPYRVDGDALTCSAGDKDPPCQYATFGKYRFDRFEGGANGDKRKVVVVTYFWEASMAALQKPFLARDLEDKGSAAINTSLKHNVIDLGFGDATAYLGEGGQLVRQGVEGAICAMLKDAAGHAPPPGDGGSLCRFAELTEGDTAAFQAIDYSFVSFSLGSRMLFDVLSGDQVQPGAGSTPGETTARVGLAVRTRNFFMLANQMPLLGIGRVSLTPAKDPASATSDQGPSFVPGVSDVPRGCGDDFFSRAGCRRGRNATSDITGVTPIADGLEVIAFHDPEDLLGFRASGGMADQGTTRFIEVRNRNAAVWLGLFANPAAAHAAELRHTTSRNLILCGASSDARGKLKPSACIPDR